MKNLNDIWQEYINQNSLSIQTLKDLIWHIENDVEQEYSIIMATDMMIKESSYSQIGGATQAAITSGNLEDIFKSAAIGGITGGVMSKFSISTELTGRAQRVAGAKLGIVNSAVTAGASTMVHGKGKLDPAALLGAGLAGASGASMVGLSKDLTERVVKDTTITAMHGGKLIPTLATGAIESTVGYLGKYMAEEVRAQDKASSSSSSVKANQTESTKAADRSLVSSPKSSVTELFDVFMPTAYGEEVGEFSKDVVASSSNAGRGKSWLQQYGEMYYDAMQDEVDYFSSKADQSSDLDVGFGKELLIGSGRAFVKTGQGLKQLGLAAGEKITLAEAGTTAKYTSYISSEKDFYEETPVGDSITAKVGEILTGIAMSTVVPGGIGSKGTGLVAGSAITGAVLGGVQATDDGSLTSRAQNAAVGAVESAVGGYVFSKTAQGLHWVWQEGKVQHGLYTFEKKAVVPHVFSKAKGGKEPKGGHVYDTPENRRLIVETYTDKKNFIYKDEHGKEFFAKVQPNGTESWAYIKNGKVGSAGVNDIPEYYNIDGSMKDAYITFKGPKP